MPSSESAGVDSTPASSACDAGNLVRLFRRRPLPQRRPHSVRPSVRLKKRSEISIHEVPCSDNHVPRSSTDPMTSKFLRLLLAVAVTLRDFRTGPNRQRRYTFQPGSATPAAAATTTARHRHQGRNHQHQRGHFRQQRRPPRPGTLQKKFEPKQNDLKARTTNSKL